MKIVPPHFPQEKENKSSSSPHPHKRFITTQQGLSKRVHFEESCSISKICSFCSLLDLPYKNQLLHKIQHLKDFLKSLGGFFADILVKDCVESDQRFGFRHTVKLRLAQSHKRNKNSYWTDIGFYNLFLRKVVDIGRCPVQAPSFHDILFWMKTNLSEYNISVFSPQQKNGLLSSVILKMSSHTGQIFVIFLVTQKNLTLFRPFVRALAEKFMNIQGVFLQYSDFPKKSFLEPELVFLTGQTLLTDRYGDLSVKFSPATEMPVNPPVTKRMYHRIHEMCDLHGSEVILDLYCGFGALSLMCALNAAQVIALDKKSSHIQDAVRNAEENHIQNITFYQGDVEKKLAEVIAEKNLLTVDVIFLNPHKEGCGVSLAEKVASLKPKSIFYISSFLDTLVQDLKHLKAHHYTPLFLEPFDSLPGTSNYDVLCYLTRESDVCD